MFTIYGGKTEFEQWGLDHLVTCSCLKKGDPVVFHGFGKNYETRAFEKDGRIYADVPNQILQESGRIRVDLGWGRDCHLDCRTYFNVVAREKPSDYEFHTNIKYKEAENSGGFTGSVKWEDIENKPFYDSGGAAPLDIRWDGSTDGKEVITPPDAEVPASLVKLHNRVFSLAEVQSCNVEVHINAPEAQPIDIVASGTDEGLVTEMAEGVYMISEFLWFLNDVAAATMGADVGVTMTGGVYCMLLPGMTIDLHLWSDTVIIVDEAVVPIPEKYLPEIPMSKLPESVQPVIYTEAVAAEIIPEQELTDDNYGVETTNWIQKPLLVGYEYTVVFNGTTYKRVATENEPLSAFANAKAILIGNHSVLTDFYGLEAVDTGEPFCIMQIEGESRIFCVAAEKQTPFTIQVSGYYANHHLIPYEYMRNPVTISVALETIPNLTGDEKTSAVTELYAAEKALKNGLDVYATYNGETVRLTSMNINEPDNMFSYGGFAKNGWQYVSILTQGGFHRILESSNALSAGYSKSIVLQSSTEGSTKKFKITIDDSGTLTTTEIT